MPEENQKPKLILKSYGHVWDNEKFVHSIENLKLPFPVGVTTAIYTTVFFILMLILSKLIPPIKAIPFVIRFFVLPFGFTKLLLYKKLDGKLPHRFFISYIRHKAKKNKRLEYFKACAPKEKLKIKWYCTTRMLKRKKR